MFQRILIANRGEIAVRIARSIQAAGAVAIAVYSDPDRDARHVHYADESVALGGARAAESYLDIQKIISAAQQSGAEAIHPGYGFLSENADFARACVQAGIAFIGPTAAAIELMANKRAAKAAVTAQQVPSIPGFQAPNATDAELIQAAPEVGYPLMVKAAAGGGGRGMRLVQGEGELAEAIASARSEAIAGFGDGELILERAITDGRHIEIQVLADQHGHVLHLFERDCSLQRRHQKVIEEAPSPFVDAGLREKMGTAAVAAARACDYVGAGTVEFLVDEQRDFYFLEMNTRLQVEHPVTEEITGVDLVDWQLRIAAGAHLDLQQADLAIDGHAIEARVYAEDPSAGFVPQTGAVLAWQPPAGTGIRVDHGMTPSGQISPYYDPMIAKVIAVGPDRETARRRLLAALANTSVLGVGTNVSYLRALLASEVFASGSATTQSIDATGLGLDALDQPVDDTAIAVLTTMLVRLLDPQPEHLQHWSNAAPMQRRRRLLIDGDKEVTVGLTGLAGAHDKVACLARGDVAQTSAPAEVVVHGHSAELFDVAVDGRRLTVRYAFSNHGPEEPCLFANVGGTTYSVQDLTYLPAQSANGPASNEIVASTEGQVVQVAAEIGARVEPGATLVVVEAMKMEHRHSAQAAGSVRAVHVSAGTQVRKGQLLVELDLDE